MTIQKSYYANKSFNIHRTKKKHLHLQYLFQVIKYFEIVLGVNSKKILDKKTLIGSRLIGSGLIGTRLFSMQNYCKLTLLRKPR